MQHAYNLGNLLQNRDIRFQISKFNPFDGTTLSSPPHSRFQEFSTILEEHGIYVEFFESRGKEILGGCGQLACRIIRGNNYG